jgi:hypothetical protein
MLWKVVDKVAKKKMANIKAILMNTEEKEKETPKKAKKTLPWSSQNKVRKKGC